MIRASASRDPDGTPPLNPRGTTSFVSKGGRRLGQMTAYHVGVSRSQRFCKATKDSSDDRQLTQHYAAIGGHEAIESVVHDFYERVLADDDLCDFFTGTNMNRFNGKQVEFFAAALGGPEPYTGAALKQVHQGRGITAHHFQLVAGHRVNALATAGVPPNTVD